MPPRCSETAAPFLSVSLMIMPWAFHNTLCATLPVRRQRVSVVGSDFTTNFHEGANTVHIGADSVGWVECNVVEGACTVD
eukprot:COSAG01_NODE_17830_length_1121_cov_1.073386_2_plen_79_part_01